MSKELIEKASELNAKFEGRLAEIITASNDRYIMVQPFRSTIRLYETALEWNRGNRDFPSWVEMIKGYMLDPELLEIDPEGKLQAIAEEYFGLNLEPFFQEYCGMEERDVETIAIKLNILRNSLKEAEAGRGNIKRKN